MKKLYITILILMCTISLAGCSNKNEESNNIQSEDTAISKEAQNTVDESSEILKIDYDIIEWAIYDHTFLPDVFILTDNHTQSLSLVEGTQDKYTNTETWLIEGRQNPTPTRQVLEGSNNTYNLSVTYDANDKFPSSINITYISDNDIDIENLLSWSYAVLGASIPLQMSSAFQNCRFGVLDENAYTEDNVDATFLKSKEYDKESGLTTVNLSISLVLNSRDLLDIKYADLSEVMVTSQSDLGLYRLGAFLKFDSVDTMNTKLASIYSNSASSRIERLSISEGYNDELGKFQTTNLTALIEDSSDLVSLILKTKETHIDEEIETREVSLSTRTPVQQSVEDSYTVAGFIINGLFRNNPSLESLYETQSSSVTFTDSEDDTYGFPFKVDFTLEEKDGAYTVSFKGNTVDNINEISEIEGEQS